jgi:TIR domain
MKSVFISHNSYDKDLARFIANELKKNAIEVWIDEEGLKEGMPVSDELAKSILGKDYFILILSKYSLNSIWVNYERRIALDSMIKNDKPIIITLKVDDSEIPASLSLYLYIDFRDNKKNGIERLIKRIFEEPKTINKTKRVLFIESIEFYEDWKFKVHRSEIIDSMFKLSDIEFEGLIKISKLFVVRYKVHEDDVIGKLKKVSNNSVGRAKQIINTFHNLNFIELADDIDYSNLGYKAWTHTELLLAIRKIAMKFDFFAD